MMNNQMLLCNQSTALRKNQTHSNLFARWVLVLASLLVLCPRAQAWGDLGHEVVVQIALDNVTSGTRLWVTRLLAQDPDPLTAHDPVSAAIWADRYRDSPENGYKANYQHTHAWHFVDLDRWHPHPEQACPPVPPLPARTPASQGAAQDCVVHKLEQFTAELKAFLAQHPPVTGAGTWPGAGPGSASQQPVTVAEAQMALKFLLHFMGDLHQPLHAIDDRDRGGNEKKVLMAGAHAGTLHHYWDSTFVELLLHQPPGRHTRGAAQTPQMGPEPGVRELAQHLEARITPANLAAWRQGNPKTWAHESWLTARTQAYDPLPPPDARGRYRLTPAYRDQACAIVALQLEQAGVRLAWVLDHLS